MADRRLEATAHLGGVTVPFRSPWNDDAVTATWEQAITVSGLDQSYTRYCEPEGMSINVLPGDVLRITFAAPQPHEFERLTRRSLSRCASRSWAA